MKIPLFLLIIIIIISCSSQKTDVQNIEVTINNDSPIQDSQLSDTKVEMSLIEYREYLMEYLKKHPMLYMDSIEESINLLGIIDGSKVKLSGYEYFENYNQPLYVDYPIGYHGNDYSKNDFSEYGIFHNYGVGTGISETIDILIPNEETIIEISGSINGETYHLVPKKEDIEIYRDEDEREIGKIYRLHIYFKPTYEEETLNLFVKYRGREIENKYKVFKGMIVYISERIEKDIFIDDQVNYLNRGATYNFYSTTNGFSLYYSKIRQGIYLPLGTLENNSESSKKVEALYISEDVEIGDYLLMDSKNGAYGIYEGTLMIPTFKIIE